MKELADRAEAQALALAIVDTLPEPFLVLDDTLHLLAGSRCFYEVFGEDPAKAHGRSLFDLSEELVGGVFSDAAPVASSEELFELPYNEAVTAARRLIVQRALERAGGHQTRAAEQLGVTQPYLSRLAKQLGLRKDEPEERASK